MILSMPNRLKDLRKAARLSQSELGIKAGFADHTPVSKYERGELDIGHDVAERFAEVLRCHPSEIYWELPNSPFTQEERRMVALSRQMTAEQRAHWIRLGGLFIRERRQKPEAKPRIRALSQFEI